MYTILLSQKQNALEKQQVATIGFFDGVHRGHQYLIKRVEEQAMKEGKEPMVITFDRHPRQTVCPDFRPQLLSTYEEKLSLLSQTGVRNCAVLHFGKDMAGLSAREFMQTVLKDRLNVSTLIIGYDNRFGHNRAEGFNDYVRYGSEMGITVLHGEPLYVEGIKVSSSVVRRYIVNDDMENARLCLGRSYSIEGKVVHGFQNGRKMGFPTANIYMTDSDKLIPSAGVYAVMATVDDSAKAYPAMMNIGHCPTFNGTSTTLEVHIIGFEGNLYGHSLRVSFLRKMRNEHKFASPDELARQLSADRNEALLICEDELSEE